MEKRSCLECQTDFLGRSDKKFCGDLCRNAYNNRIRSEENFVIRTINSILKKNRRILAFCNPDGKTRIRRDKLLSCGFNFNYFTNIYRTGSGREYYFCYDQGYLILDGEYVKLVVKEEYVD